MPYGRKYNTEGKLKIKPTLYFTQEELDKIEKLRIRGGGWVTDSVATFIENCVKKQLEHTPVDGA